ncbi:MAG: LCP family protein [Clostridia bacterium]|nr:LCP family protein [Clostridia bacterium]
MSSRKLVLSIIGIIALICIIITAVIFVVNADALQKLFFRESGESGKTASELYREMQSVTIGDKTYMQRDKITTLLIIGLDSFGVAVSSESYNNSQQADFLTLVIMDDETKEYSLLHLNRDTMTDITVLDITGLRKVKTMKAQLALSHTYGNGLHTSCLNTVDAVSTMLYGLRVDYYLSMTMDAAQILTDELGGITITIDQDLTIVNPEWSEGTVVTLNGEEALEYVRLRSELPDSSNISRMERQKHFMNALIDKLIETKKGHLGNSYFLSLYDSVDEYIVTNGSTSAFSEMADKMTEYQNGGIWSPKGEAKKGTEFMEFYVDEEDLQQLAIRLFYRLSK